MHLCMVCLFLLYIASASQKSLHVTRLAHECHLRGSCGIKPCFAGAIALEKTKRRYIFWRSTKVRKTNAGISLTAAWVMSCYALPVTGVVLRFMESLWLRVLGLVFLSVPIVVLVASFANGYAGRMDWNGTWRYAIIPAVLAALASEDIWGSALAHFSCIYIAVSYLCAKFLGRVLAVAKSDLRPEKKEEELYETV